MLLQVYQTRVTGRRRRHGLGKAKEVKMRTKEIGRGRLDEVGELFLCWVVGVRDHDSQEQAQLL